MPTQLVSGDSEQFLLLLLEKENLALDAARQDPERALLALRRVMAANTGTLSLVEKSHAYERILSFIQDPTEALALIVRHFAPSERAELVKVTGDLGSVALGLEEIEVVLDAVMGDLAEENLESRLEPYFMLRAWAMKMKDRPHWQEELDIPLGEGTLSDFLITAVYLSDRWKSDDEQENASEEVVEEEDDRENFETQSPEIPPEAFIEVGLDPDDAQDRLQELLSSDQLPEFSEYEAAEAQRIIRERSQSYAQEPVSAVSSATSQVADQMDW